MIYPTYELKDLEHSMRFYNENPDLYCGFVDREGGNITLEEIINKMDARARKFDERDEKSLIILRDNSDLLSYSAIIIINKLLGDRKLRDKCYMVCDGSGLMNRLWSPYAHDTGGMFHIEIELSYKAQNEPYCKYFNSLHTKDKLEWLYNHFERIHLQLPIIKNREDVIKHTTNSVGWYKDYDSYGDYDE